MKMDGGRQPEVASSLFESQTNPLLAPPGDLTGLARTITGNPEREAVGKPKWRIHLNRRTGRGEIANHAGNSAAAELDCSGLVHAATWGSGLFVHFNAAKGFLISRLAGTA